MVASGFAWAQQDSDPAAAGDAEEQAGQEVLVREDAGQQVREIRRQGRLDSIVVTPQTGPSYIFEDRGGVEGMQSPQEGSEIDSGFNIRTWKLGEW